jgi:hypothetical protein
MLPGLYEVGEASIVVDLFLVAYLLIEDDELAFDASAFGELSIETVLDLRNFNLLDLRGVSLELLTHLLEHLALLL